MKIAEIEIRSDKFHSIAKQIEKGIVSALIQHSAGMEASKYEDTIRSVSFDALEELINRVYEIENR